ncbi:uncharacterized protein EI97DRAFT_422255 [Westerdykella ornata]|uniref:Methyltransferase domain-containing protein n=1 Tax=Westerdykella ornata TaxID=318751 RepID=A0A6A6JEB7_WESOR|nr:uncharacterized protein EI97DRAFT_422255 [Westerdykella ornata]KAF2274564.1 hypothetical protein EI97DRAFT_422255 [Westerdykella ornata]
MPPQPPSFGSQEYWDTRFTSNSNPFEWLEAPTALDSYLVEALRSTEDESPQILHIGCGTSLLSYHLRAHVDNPELIHNLDYSDVAIKVGKQREIDIYEGEVVQSPANRDMRYMRWSTADLLSHSSLLHVCNPNTYYVIVDKSTSDSIACSEDVYVPLPYPIGTTSDISTSPVAESPEPIHPLHILAIHLALVTKPGAYWISLSYSEDRFPFLPHPSAHASATHHDLIDNGFPDPGQLWRLEARHEIEVLQSPTGDAADKVVHRPRVVHWVYVLRRTDVEVFVRDP